MAYEKDKSLYLRSHHHPSTPLLYSAFNQLNLSRVATHRHLDMSVCLSISKGTLVESVQAQDTFIFTVARVVH